MRLRLGIFATHPVQYHVPLWRALTADPSLDVRVFYFSDHSLRGSVDPGFGVPVAWDIDLESGYTHEFVSRTPDLHHPGSISIPDVKALLTQQRLDWALFSGYTYGFQLQLARNARRHGVRLLMRGEFSDGSATPRPFAKRIARSAYLRWFYRHVSRFCYPGEHARHHLLAHGVHGQQLFFSPYSVDDQLIERARSTMTRTDARRELDIPEDQFTFVFSGKLVPRKDPMAVLDAIQRMQRTERIGLIVLGDGELAPAVKSRAQSLLGNRALCPGFVNQSQLVRYFSAADALVLPSRYETWGLVVNEAMHYGLPVIATDHTGCHANLVCEGKTGFVYPCNRNDVLAERMQTLVDDPGLARQLGQAAREHVSQYTIAASARGVFEALDLNKQTASHA